MKKIIFTLLGVTGWVAVAGSALAVEKSIQGESLSCRDFIQCALDKDPQFNTALQTYLQARYSTLSSQAMADWVLGAGVGVVYNESVSGSAFEPERIDSLVYQLSLQKLFLVSGTRLSIRHENALTDTVYTDPALLQALGSTVDETSSSPQVTFSIVQPLLKNALGMAERYPVIAAELQRRAALLDVQEAWENRIAQLYGSYLNWKAAYESVVALREIVTDLKKLESLIGRKVRSGVSERSDLLRARDNVLRFSGQLAQAEGVYRNETLNILFLQSGRAFLPQSNELPNPVMKLVLPNLEKSKSAAIKTVGDLRLLQKLVLLEEQYQASAQVANNAQLPSLDFVGDLTYKGQTGDGDGGYNTFDKHDYSVMLQASYPLGNRQAEGDVGKAQAGLAELASTRSSTAQSMSLALLQMAETIKQLEQLVVFQKEQLTNAQEQLALDKRNYRIGRLDTFYLIDSQNSLTNARLQLVQSEIQHNTLQVEYLALSDQLLGQFPQVTERLQD